MKVTVEDAKCVQGSAFLQAEMFEEFKLGQSVIAFKINLNVLLVRSYQMIAYFLQDCLSVFGVGNTNSLTSVIITYKDHGNTLDLL